MSNSDYKPYVGDQATVIEVDMQEDLSSWSNLKFYVKKPKVGGGMEEKIVNAAQKAGDGNEQIMQYIIGAGSGEAIVNFDVAGEYYFQPYGELGSWKGKGDTINFIVYDPYG